MNYDKLTAIRMIFNEMNTPYQQDSALRAKLEENIAKRLSNNDISDLGVLIRSSKAGKP